MGDTKTVAGTHFELKLLMYLCINYECNTTFYGYYTQYFYTWVYYVI